MEQAAVSTTIVKNEALSKCEIFYSSFLKNPYRILGLVGANSQADLKKSLSTIRRQAKVGKAFASPLDLSWVGLPPSRNERDLIDAETKLLNPTARLQNRLLWLHAPTEEFQANLSPAEAAQISQRWAASNDAAALHDAAVMMQFAAMSSSPDCADQTYWKQAMLLWQAVQLNDAYWNMLGEIDEQLGFEPVCRPSDVVAQREKFMDLVTEPLVLLSKDALNSGNQQIFAQASALLKLAAAEQTASSNDISGSDNRDVSESSNAHFTGAGNSEIVEEFRRKIDGFADEIKKILEERVDRNEKTLLKSRETNINTCGQCESIFKYDVEPVIQNAESLLCAGDSALYELKETAAAILVAIANGYTWADAYGESVRVAEQAMQLVKDTPSEPKVAELLEHFRKSHAMLMRFGEQKKIGLMPTLFTFNTIGFTIYPALNEPPEPQLSSQRAIYYLVVLMLPLFPLASYRVVFHPNRTYSFISRIPLDKYARIHQLAFLLVLFGSLYSFITYKPDPAVTERNTSAAMARVKNKTPMPKDKYGLKDLINSDDDALKDLENRLTAFKPGVQKESDTLKVLSTKLESAISDKKADPATVEALKSDLQKKTSQFQHDVDSYNATADMYDAITKQRNEAAEYYNSNFARH